MKKINTNTNQNENLDVNEKTNNTINPTLNAEQMEDDALAMDSKQADLTSSGQSNSFLRNLMDSNFIEYASYVIKERAIPDVDDGLKPVQRRILWALHKLNDGKFHKVANVVGDTMKYHPHGDASIGDALVVLANKEYFIEKQGNFGNIFTGDPASASRYIECRLKPIVKEVLFNNDITKLIDSYDGRNKEPVALPAKIPSLLLLGTEGIAVGLSTKILSHNFLELIEAQIAILKNKTFEIYPDFPQGGIMDVAEYEEGNGKIRIRAKIRKEGRKLIITEIPATTTTESLIASIEKAVARNKMKLAAINDYTTDKVEIEVVPMRGYDTDNALQALYSYTDCSVSVSVNLMVICDGQPVQMTVPSVLRRNTEKTLDYFRQELEIEKQRLNDKLHEKTLERIFIENRIYKRIEQCKTFNLVLQEIYKGFEKFKNLLRQPLVDDDIQHLLAIQIRRISLFDMNKNREEIDELLKKLEEVEYNLTHLKKYTINFLKNILKKYGTSFQRKTEIETFKKIDRHSIALNNIVVGWDRKNCYIGTHVKSDDKIKCNEYDHLLLIERSGKYKVTNIPDKVFVGRIYYFGKYDKKQLYYIVYSEKKSGRFYYKKCKMGSFITDKEYKLCPDGCKLEIITTRANSLYEFNLESRIKDKRYMQINLSDAPERSAKARGLKLSSKSVTNFKFLAIQEPKNSTEIQDTSPLDNSQIPETNTKTENMKNKLPEKNPQTSNISQQPIENELFKSSEISEHKSSPENKRKNKKVTGKIKKLPEMKNDDDDTDSWGVQQPEFGF